MKVTTIRIGEDILERAHKVAKAQSMSFSALVKRAVLLYLAQAEKEIEGGVWGKCPEKELSTK